MPDWLQAWAAPIMALAFALPCFAMGVRLLHVWRRPLDIEDGRWVQLGVGVMVMEFVLLHAGVFLAGVAVGAEGLATTLLGILGLTVFYGLFVAVIAYAFKSRMLLESFLWMVGGRLFAILIGIAGEDSRLLMSYSALALMIYMPMVFASVFLPFPKWGISQELAARFRMPGSSGIWVDAPHRAIGAGVIYFFVLGATTLWVIGRGGFDLR